MNGKHSQNNRESKEGQILRFIRETRKLSLQDVAEKTHFKAIEVDHLENGRRFYTPEDIIFFLDFYNFSYENFKTILAMKIINKQIVNHYIITNKS